MVALLAPVLAACGFGAQTDQVYQAAQGVNDRSGTIEILNAAIVAATDGSGTFAGSLVNESDTAQTISNITAVDATPTGVNITIPGKTLVNLANPVPGTNKPQLSFAGNGIKVGGDIRLIFTFSGGGSSMVDVPVVSNDSSDGSEYANVPLPLDPNATPTTTPTSVGGTQSQSVGG